MAAKNIYGLYGEPDFGLGQPLPGGDRYVRSSTYQDNMPNYFSPGRSRSMAAGLTPNSNSARYSTLRLPKNPLLEALNTQNIGRVGKAGNENDSDLGGYINTSRANAGANAGDLGGELGSVDAAYNGALDARLGGIRGDYKSNVLGLNTQAATDFGNLRGDYRTEGGNLIDRLGSDLAGQRGRYEGRVGGEITAEELARAGMRKGYGVAARRGTDLAIAGAERGNKAAQAQAGGGGSSYFSRLALGTRNAAESDLAQRLADREYQDYGITRGQRAGLSSELGGMERGELAGAGEQRMRLADLLASRAREDYGHTLGVNERLNDTLGQQERGDLGYLRSEQARGLGVRRGLRNAAAGDLLAPIAARQSTLEGNLRLGGSLGAIDERNTFYGIDDNRAEFPQFGDFPRQPRYNPSFDMSPNSGGYRFTNDQYGPQDGLEASRGPRGKVGNPAAAWGRRVNVGPTTGMYASGQSYEGIPLGYDYSSDPTSPLYVRGYNPDEVAAQQAYYE